MKEFFQLVKWDNICLIVQICMACSRNKQQFFVILILGLDAMEAWMKKIGLVMNITELGAAEAMLDGMVKSTLIMDGGYKVMDADDIRAVLQASF